MRIAMLSWETLHSIAVGGVSAHVTELAAALARQGHDVHVFTRIAPGQPDYAKHDGVHYYRCPYRGDREFVDDVNNMCRAFVHRVFGVEDSTGKPFDIVHAHDWLCANAMIWIKQGRQRRSILTVHATEFGRCGNVFHGGRSARIREQERAGCYWADHVIAVSHATRAEIMWMYEVPDWKCSVVYNGVSRHRFDRPIESDKVRKRYQIGPMDPVVLFCGRLAHQKGPDILLEAFPAALNRYGHSKLLFAGDGELRGELERRGRHLGVAHALRFLGYRNGDELVDLFKMCDVVCVPSRNEPFGIVVLEAWSAGKPVVVTHNGGPGEYVDHEVNGLKVFDNPNSVAWGLNRIFDDFERARKMGEAGHEAVVNGFTWDIVAEQTLDAYIPERAKAQHSAVVDAKPVALEPGVAEPIATTAPTEGEDHGDSAIEPPAPAEPATIEQVAGEAIDVPGTQSGEAHPLPVDLHALSAEAGCEVTGNGDGVVKMVGDWEKVIEGLHKLVNATRENGGARPRVEVGIHIAQPPRSDARPDSSVATRSPSPTTTTSSPSPGGAPTKEHEPGGDNAHIGSQPKAHRRKARKRSTPKHMAQQPPTSPAR